MSGRTVLITGGAKGIGRAIGSSLAKDGWKVAVCYRTSRGDAESAVEEFRAAGAPAVLAERCDVSDPEACASLIETTRSECGSIDALIHCAGPYERKPILKESIEGWHAMFDNNLHPVFYLSRLAAPAMIEAGWGRILTFGMAGADRLKAQPQITSHYIAKSSILILTRTLAKVLGPHAITVNSISPGFIHSGSAPLEELEGMLKFIPAGYIGELSDVVSAARFLISDEARYVNGANLEISGGWGL